MHLYWTIQWDELEIKGYTPDDRYVLLEAKTTDGTLVWTKTIDATQGDTSLMSRTWVHLKPTKEKPFLVVGTDGEHYRGASSHLENFTKFTKEGNVVK
jgi:hypothetical protein